VNSRRLCALVCWYLLILCSPLEAAEESPVNLAPNISAGKYLFQAAGGCSCHTDTKNNSAFLAGGRPIETLSEPFTEQTSPPILKLALETGVTRILSGP